MKERRRRDRKRDFRGRMQALAWTFIAFPLFFVIAGRQGSAIELAFGPVVGALMLLWQWRHPVPPEHVAAVERVRGEFFLAWCDCGWNGDDQETEDAARSEAQQHTEHVQLGLHAWED